MKISRFSYIIGKWGEMMKNQEFPDKISRVGSYAQTITINIFTDSDLCVKIFKRKHLSKKNLPIKVIKVKLNVTEQDCY